MCVSYAYLSEPMMHKVCGPMFDGKRAYAVQVCSVKRVFHDTERIVKVFHATPFTQREKSRRVCASRRLPRPAEPDQVPAPATCHHWGSLHSLDNSFFTVSVLLLVCCACSVDRVYGPFCPMTGNMLGRALDEARLAPLTRCSDVHFGSLPSLTRWSLAINTRPCECCSCPSSRQCPHRC